MEQRWRLRPSRGLAPALAVVAAALSSAPALADISLAFGSTGGTSGSGSSSGEALAEVGAYVAKGLAAGFRDGERRLALIQESVWTDAVCDGQPLVMARTDGAPPNGGCLPEQTLYNLSCSCLLGFDNSSEWTFLLRAPTAADAADEEMPVEVDKREQLAVSSMMTIDLPEEVATLYVAIPDDSFWW